MIPEHSSQNTATTGTFRLLRENAWVKEWLTPWNQHIVDPKTRWLAWIPTAAEFIAAWDAAGATARQDLQAAFTFYPYELETEIAAVLSHLEQTAPQASVAMRASLFTPSSELSPQQQRFTRALATHLEVVGAPKLLAMETRFCCVMYNDAGFHLDLRISSSWEVPTDPELLALLPATLTPETLRRHRVVQLLRANRGLLEPEPGAQPLPGMDELPGGCQA